MNKALKEKLIIDINYDRFGCFGGSLQMNLIHLINHIDQQDQKIEKMQKQIQQLELNKRYDTGR